jgi:release factor glutamine methyltransferase
MLLQEVLNRTTSFFREKGIDSARLDAELLLAGALGLRRIDIYLKFDQPLAEPELERCRAFVRRRSSGEPVAYILGSKSFFDLEFYVDKRVLIPRPETELLVEKALDWTSKIAIGDRTFWIADFGTGSGCILSAMLVNLPQAQGVAVEKSADALEVATGNFLKLGVLDRVKTINLPVQELLHYDELVIDGFDIILANPPYISHTDSKIEENVKKFEPHLALFSGDDGLQQPLEWLKVAIIKLKAKGFLGMELDPAQIKRVQKELLESKLFTNIEIIKDLSGLERHITAIKH